MDNERVNKEECPCPEGMTRKEGTCVMPEVTFTTLIMSLESSAFFHMGELASPDGAMAPRNKLLARHSIDTLTMLQDKTKGNLSVEEEELLTNSLSELKLSFVRIFAADASGSV